MKIDDMEVGELINDLDYFRLDNIPTCFVESPGKTTGTGCLVAT
jgi:hypothetical protein